MDHSRSLEMSLFDRMHTTSNSSLMESMRLYCIVFEIQRVTCLNSPTFTYPTCIDALIENDLFELREGIWRQKTRIHGLSYGAVSVILRQPFWYNSDLCQTDRQTQTQTQIVRREDSLYRVSISRAVKACNFRQITCYISETVQDGSGYGFCEKGMGSCIWSVEM